MPWLMFIAERQLGRSPLSSSPRWTLPTAPPHRLPRPPHCSRRPPCREVWTFMKNPKKKSRRRPTIAAPKRIRPSKVREVLSIAVVVAMAVDLQVKVVVRQTVGRRPSPTVTRTTRMTTQRPSATIERASSMSSGEMMT